MHIDWDLELRDANVLSNIFLWNHQVHVVTDSRRPPFCYTVNNGSEGTWGAGLEHGKSVEDT